MSAIHDCQYDKEFAANTLFGADIKDMIHKQVKVFLQSCNTSRMGDDEMAALAEFGDLKWRVEHCEWIISILI